MSPYPLALARRRRLRYSRRCRRDFIRHAAGGRARHGPGPAVEALGRDRVHTHSALHEASITTPYTLCPASWHRDPRRAPVVTPKNPAQGPRRARSPRHREKTPSQDGRRGPRCGRGILVPLSPNKRSCARPCPPVGAFGHRAPAGETEAGLDRRTSTS